MYDPGVDEANVAVECPETWARYCGFRDTDSPGTGETVEARSTWESIPCSDVSVTIAEAMEPDTKLMVVVALIVKERDEFAVKRKVAVAVWVSAPLVPVMATR
jgi:hypothetical protein